MAISYFDANWTAKVTVPVKRIGERWEFFYGGDVPVKEGTLGELTISIDQITDKRFQTRVTQETEVKILDEGAALIVALSDRSTGGRRVGEQWTNVDLVHVPAGTTRFVQVTIGPAKPSRVRVPRASDAEEGPNEAPRGGLWLRLKGLERSELASSTIVMPEGSAETTAVSLNHAFTMLSKVHETHRISNTGNVYDRVFYRESNSRWYPLALLRQGVQATTERKLIGDVWQQVEAALGWRPIAPPEKAKRK